ncbi:MAG: NAD-dependent epimerase/dehydratase family protein, partial [Armatimonadota bacterium]
MRVLVTGGAGFIGSHLVEALVRDGRSVVVADNLTTGKTENIAPVMDKIDFRVLDIAQLDQAREAVKGVDAVLHHAALASVQGSVDDPVGADRINTTGTINMLQAAREADVKRFVFAASAAAYGDDPSFPKVETQAPRPLSPYAVAKIAGEYYCSVFWQLYGLPTICLRYFNVFGPRQNPKSEYAAVIPKFIARMVDGQPPTIFGDGEQSRDFIYIGDVVRANLLALDTDKGFGEVINAAGGRSLTLNQLFGAIR